MAKSSKKSRQSYCKYENGVSAMDLETINKLADYFDVSADYLCGISKIGLNAEMMLAGECRLIEFSCMFKQLSKCRQKDIVGFVRFLYLAELKQVSNSKKRQYAAGKC